MDYVAVTVKKLAFRVYEHVCWPLGVLKLFDIGLKISNLSHQAVFLLSLRFTGLCKALF